MIRRLARRYGPVAGLLALTLGSFWLLRELRLDEQAGDGGARHVPDYYLENFTSTTMDAEGRPERRLTAVHMAHFEDTGASELDKPFLKMFEPGQPPWEVESERGWVSASREVMLLLGDVHIWRDQPDGTRTLDLRTQDLRVLPDRKYGETDKAATIRTPTSVTRGVGMRAYLDTSRIELLSQVKTVYEQPNP